jgi:hypothetical protein
MPGTAIWYRPDGRRFDPGPMQTALGIDRAPPLVA